MENLYGPLFAAALSFALGAAIVAGNPWPIVALFACLVPLCWKASR